MKFTCGIPNMCCEVDSLDKTPTVIPTESVYSWKDDFLKTYENRINEIYEEESKVDEKWALGLKYSTKVLEEVLKKFVATQYGGKE